MTELAGPLAADCAALRQRLIDDPLPAVWELDPVDAQARYRELSIAGQSSWRPALAGMPVDSQDVPVPAGVPAIRRYVPSAGASDVALVWLHGGGWVLGDLDTAEPTARTASAQTGWTVLSVDYRLAPQHAFPAAAHDAVAATRWALESYPRVVVGGDSAGANLAGVVAQQLGAVSGLVAQVLVYPVVDVALDRPSALEFTEGPFLTAADMRWYRDRYLPEHADWTDPLVDLRVGLAAATAKPLPAVLFTVGHDPLRDEGIEYAALLATAGGTVTWLHAPELFHGAFTNSGYLPSAAERVTEVWRAATSLVG